MTLEEIQKEADKDLKLDDTELDKEAIRIPQLHNKYLIFFNQTKLSLKKMEYDRAELIRIKWEYYSGKMSEDELKTRNWTQFPLKILRQDLDQYLSSDKDIHQIDIKIAYCQQKLEYIESLLKGIMNRHWLIRSIIDWKKFTNGVV